MKLLLSTHSRVLEFDTETFETQIVHQGRGVYYGLVPDWVVSRSHRECLLNLKTNQEVSLPSKFTHDATWSGSRVLVADCEGGAIVELESMKVARHVRMFSVKNHVNTIAIVNDNVWALLHNLGKSILVRVDMDTGKWLQRVDNVGHQSHGLVWWGGGFLILSSQEGSIIHVTTETKVLWKDSKFLKGLCVVGDVAYFGISNVTARSDRGSPNLQCEVGAFDLCTNKLLWRHRVQTCGLLNSLAFFGATTGALNSC